MHEMSGSDVLARAAASLRIAVATVLGLALTGFWALLWAQAPVFP
jgi:hypothetical protein